MTKKIFLFLLLSCTTVYAGNLQLQCARSSDGITTKYRCQILEQNKITLSLANSEKLYTLLSKHTQPDCGAGTCRVTFTLQS